MMTTTIDKKTTAQLDERSVQYRRDILNILKSAGRGHVGSALSILEIVRVLYDDVLNFDATNPFWDERDRFILSKGHGCLGLYILLAEKGFFPKEELLRFCEPTSILGGHPDYPKVPGVEASTGSLGHGFSIGIGVALTGKIDKKRYCSGINSFKKIRHHFNPKKWTNNVHSISQICVILEYLQNIFQKNPL